MQVVGSGSKVWRQVGVGSGDAGSLLNCDPNGKNVLLLWAEIVSKRDLKGLPKVRKVKLDQGTDEWLKWRNQGLGGSEVGTVMQGKSGYADSHPLKIWGRKLPDDHPDKVPDVPDNAWMRQGREREPLAREMYEQLFGWKVEPVCVISDVHECVRCSLDGLSENEKINVEIKCSQEKNHMRYVSISRIEDPFERQCAFDQYFRGYRYQQLYQLLITGAEVSHFVAFNPTMYDPADRFATFAFYPEPAEQERLLQRVLEFWSFVESRTPPPPDWLIPCGRPPEPGDLRLPVTTSV